MAYAMNNGVKLYYEVYGQGVPLFMIMGLGGRSDAWAFQIKFFTENNFKVIVMDNRGVGKSDKPDSVYDMGIFASDVLAVMDDAKIKKAHFMGLSMGGLITQEFYHQNKDRVISLILGCTGVGAGDPAFIYPSTHVNDVLTLMADDKLDALYVMRKKAEIFYHPSYIKLIPDLAERMLAMVKESPQPTHAYKHQLEACFLKEPFWNSPRLSKIDVPTLIYHGEDDQIWELDNAKYMHKHIKDSVLEVMNGAAHMFFIEKYQEFNEKVLKFLNSLDD